MIKMGEENLEVEVHTIPRVDVKVRPYPAYYSKGDIHINLVFFKDIY